MSSAANSTERNRKTPVIFYLILGVLPLLFFIFLELGLRLAGYGYDYKLFSEKKGEGAIDGMLYLNPDITYKYFGNLKSPVFNSQIGFYKEKPENSIRVFVLGGSSTQGFPYNTLASFPAHLQRQLDLAYPEKIVEVINLGASAINSYTLLDIIPEVLEQSPDMILIYAGHNEYYGALGPGSSKSVNQTLARTLLYLREYRTVQLMQNTIASVVSQNTESNESLMQRMIGQSSIEYGSETYLRGIEQYENNLDEIVRTITAAEVSVIIGTLASNLADLEPFNSDQKSNEGYSASDYYQEAKKRANVADSIGAKNNFILAKEYDGLRFRAPEKMNEIIKATASKYNIPMVDIENIFIRNSSLGIVGNNLMCDHLHPNLAGYYLMSKAYFEAIFATPFFPAPDKSYLTKTEEIDSLLTSNFPYTALDTLVDNHLLLTGLGQYPFVPVGEPNPYQSMLDSDGINFTARSYDTIDSIRSLVAWRYFVSGDTTSFLKEMNVFLHYFPYSEVRYMHAIEILKTRGILNESYSLIFGLLNRLKESRAKNKAIGLYYKHFNSFDSALVYLEKARKYTPRDEPLTLDIGEIYFDTDNYAMAVAEYSKVIELSPENMEAYHHRAISRYGLKDYKGTIEDISKSIELKDKPDTLSYIIRGYANYGLKNTKAACADWQMSANLGARSARSLLQNYCQGQN